MTEGLSAPQPGMFFLTQIGGFTGRWVAAAQAFVRGGSMWTHAGLVLDNGWVIQAEPGGSRLVKIDTLLDGRTILFSDAPIQRWMETHPDVDEAWIRHHVAQVGRCLVGFPYSFLDYLALALAEWKVPGWQLVRRRVETSKHMICSALVDRAYSYAGINLYDDGRLPGDVTPGDLDLYDDTYCNEIVRRHQA